MKTLDAKDFLHRYGKYLAGTILIGVAAYFALMAEELNNNYDGIWHLSHFIAGDFEISLGRGLERYADRARFGIVSSPLNTILCLILAGIVNILIIRRFELEDTWYAWILVFLLTVNPGFCDTLSYIYLAVNYLLAYLFSALSFYILSDPGRWENGWGDRKGTLKHLETILIGGAFLAVSMEFYQAYFCVLCTLLLFYGIRCCVAVKDLRKLGNYYLDGFAGIAAGGILYLILTKLLLFRAGITLADYKGVSDISLSSVLLHLPVSVVRCYQETAAWLFRDHFWMNLEFSGILTVLLVILFAASAMLAVIHVARASVWHLIPLILSFLMIPVGGCAILVLAVGNIMTGIMGTGLLLCVVLFPLLIPPLQDRITRICRGICLAALILFGWYAISTVTNDQLALREGRTATVTLAQNIVRSLYQEPDQLKGRMVALVGRPGNNPAFAQSVAYARANEYAQFGLWSTDPRNNRVSWYGVLTNYLGVNLPLCDDVTFDEIRGTQEVADMPVYPAAGSIRIIGDTVVVKVSELYQ